MKQGQQHPHTRRIGFTLIETLVAVSLCGVLLAAAYTAIGLYWKHRSLSQQRIASAQVLRAVVEDITLDCRSAVPERHAKPLDEDDETSQNNAQEKLITEEEFRTRLRLLGIMSSGEPIHFYGRSDVLLLLTSYDSTRFPQRRPGQRLRHVVWFVNQQNPVRVPVTVGDKPVTQEISLPDQPPGLTRLELDVNSATLQSDTVSPRTNEPSLCDDVVSIQFEYFDGEGWIDQWSTSDVRRLPEAIRVQLQLRNQTTTHEAVVIRLPQSHPAKPGRDDDAE